MGGGVSRDKHIPECVGCSSVESGHELSAMGEFRYSPGRVKKDDGRG